MPHAAVLSGREINVNSDTYIPPKGKNLPSPITSPNDFLHVQWNKVYYKVRDAFSLWVLKWSGPGATKGSFKRLIKLQRSTIAPTAVALHRQMYTAFSEGDVPSLKRMCADGMFHSFSTRIGNRPRGETMKWELIKYNGSAKLVSNRAARLPIDGMAVQQSIVRISSTQRLTRWSREKQGLVQIEGTGQERDVVEYVVVQRMYKEWKGGDWIVWGTTKETLLDDVDDWKVQQKAELQ